MKFYRFIATAWCLAVGLDASVGLAQALDVPEFTKQIDSWLDREYPRLDELYKHLHRHPELSWQSDDVRSARFCAEKSLLTL